MNEELYISFENYLQNGMTVEEKAEFEERLKDDKDFSGQFEAYKEATLHLEHKFSEETVAFKQNLSKISNAYFADKGKQKGRVISFRPWYYGVAASIAIVLGTWFSMQNSSPNYYDFPHEEAYFVGRDSVDADKKKAQDLFNNKDYRQAVATFEKMERGNQELDYFYAISLIETDNYAKAESMLKDLQNGNSVYKEKAIWYRALLELKQGDLQACGKMLKQIPEDAEDYERAQKLLKDLD